VWERNETKKWNAKLIYLRKEEQSASLNIKRNTAWPNYLISFFIYITETDYNLTIETVLICQNYSDSSTEIQNIKETNNLIADLEDYKSDLI